MKIGFTGTRFGMTIAQRSKFRKLIKELDPEEFHHGDCVGGDADAHNDVMTMPNRRAKTVGHPPDNTALRAFTNCDIMRNPLPYIERNHVIVDETQVLLAAPATEHEVLRSGTWATVRYAHKENQGRKKKKRIIIITREGHHYDYPKKGEL